MQVTSYTHWSVSWSWCYSSKSPVGAAPSLAGGADVRIVCPRIHTLWPNLTAQRKSHDRMLWETSAALSGWKYRTQLHCKSGSAHTHHAHTHTHTHTHTHWTETRAVLSSEDHNEVRTLTVLTEWSFLMLLHTLFMFSCSSAFEWFTIQSDLFSVDLLCECH